MLFWASKRKVRKTVGQKEIARLKIRHVSRPFTDMKQN